MGSGERMNQIEFQSDGAKERKERFNKLDIFKRKDKAEYSHDNGEQRCLLNDIGYFQEEGKGKNVHPNDGAGD